MAKKDDTTRTAIIDAACILFRKYGYDHITMEDVAKAVHKKRPTVYIYFKNKDDLFFSIIQNEVDLFYQQLETGLSKYDKATDKLKAFFYLKYKFITGRTDDLVMLGREVVENTLILRTLREQHESRQFDFIKNIMLVGIDNGDFLSLTDKKLNETVWVLLLAMRGITVGYCSGQLNIGVSEISQMLYAMAVSHDLLSK